MINKRREFRPSSLNVVISSTETKQEGLIGVVIDFGHNRYAFVLCDLWWCLEVDDRPFDLRSLLLLLYVLLFMMMNDDRMMMKFQTVHSLRHDDLTWSIEWGVIEGRVDGIQVNGHERVIEGIRVGTADGSWMEFVFDQSALLPTIKPEPCPCHSQRAERTDMEASICWEHDDGSHMSVEGLCDLHGLCCEGWNRSMDQQKKNPSISVILEEANALLRENWSHGYFEEVVTRWDGWNPQSPPIDVCHFFENTFSGRTHLDTRVVLFDFIDDRLDWRG